MSKRIAVLGLGAMGSRMATRLIDAGYELTVWNRSPERAASLRKAGATVADSPREATAGQDVVIACVRDDGASRGVWLDPDAGALGGLGAGAIAVESSTLTPAWTTELAERIRSAGVRFLEAPVAGSRPQAEAGKLAYLVGGTAQDLEATRPILEVLGAAVHHVGPPGTGAVMKLVVNAYLGVQVAAMAELLGLAEKGGVSSAAEVLSALPVTSPALAGIAGLIARDTYQPMFPVELVEKDFAYAETAAGSLGAELPTTAAVRRVYRRALEAGLGAENIHAVAKLFR